jgi:hypothetical protein
MQAIVTKYIGPTNHRGARVKATCQAKSIIVNWSDALDIDENHLKAATALAWSLGWDKYGNLHGGGMPDGSGNCYVIVKRPVLRMESTERDG